MIWLIIILLILIISFGGVLLFGAPYLPTMKPQVKAALELAELKPGDTLLELGCGDGRVMIAAARRGVNVIGYELNPLMAAIAWMRMRRYRKNSQVIWGDFWQKQWPEAEAIFTFLIPRYMNKLHTKVSQEAAKPVKLVSFAFMIPDKPAMAHKDGIYLYYYDRVG